MKQLSIFLMSIGYVCNVYSMQDDTKHKTSLSQAQYLWMNSRLRDVLGEHSFSSDCKEKKRLFINTEYERLKAELTKDERNVQRSQ